MFDIIVNKNDIKSIRDYMENKGLVGHMNNAGLTYSAMAVVLEAIRKECDRIEKEMGVN